jgi:hypothetical protein
MLKVITTKAEVPAGRRRRSSVTLDDLAREYARCLSGVERDENVLPVGAAALMLAEARLGNDPANTQWQRDLSVSHERIGDVLVAQGDGPGALTAYRQGLAIAETLTARDPANTQWQRDLVVSYVKLGEVTKDRSYVATAWRSRWACRSAASSRRAMPG